MLEYTDPAIIWLAKHGCIQVLQRERETSRQLQMMCTENRKCQPHGGVAIIAKAEFDAVEIELSTKTEFVAASFACKNLKQPLVVGSVDRPIDNNYEYAEDIRKAVTHICSTYKNSTIWIGGDINLSDIDWKTNSIVSNNYPIPINKSIIDMIHY